jgi:serine/threonine-protein kinase
MIKNIGIALALLLGTFLIGYLVATRVLFPPLPTPENGIVVPRLSGQLIESAERQLQPLGLRAAREVVRVAHASQPPGIIVAQSPLPGQQLREGGVVRFAVSSGLPGVKVPNVVGFEVARALAVLKQLGLTAEQVMQQNSRPAGTVISISPEAGQRQPLPARVRVIVSSGPPPIPPDSISQPDSLALQAPNPGN